MHTTITARLIPYVMHSSRNLLATHHCHNRCHCPLAVFAAPNKSPCFARNNTQKIQYVWNDERITILAWCHHVAVTSRLAPLRVPVPGGQLW
jgi:hypothetical protein